MLYAHTQRSRAKSDGIYISTKTSTVCYILDSDMKFSRFQGVKKERRVNAFRMSCSPTRIALDRASAMRSAIVKLHIIFYSPTINRLKFQTPVNGTSVRHEADVGALTWETEYATYLWRREHYAAEDIYRDIQIKPPERCVGRAHSVGNTP